MDQWNRKSVYLKNKHFYFFLNPFVLLPEYLPIFSVSKRLDWLLLALFCSDHFTERHWPQVTDVMEPCWLRLFTVSSSSQKLRYIVISVRAERLSWMKRKWASVMKHHGQDWSNMCVACTWCCKSWWSGSSVWRPF